MLNPAVAILQQLTPENIRALTRDQLSQHIGLSLIFTPEERQQCQWQLALLQERRNLLTQRREQINFIYNIQSIIDKLALTTTGDKATIANLRAAIDKHESTIPTSATSLLTMKTKEVVGNSVQTEKVEKPNHSEHSFLGCLSVLQQMGSRLFKPDSKNPQKQSFRVKVEQEQESQSFLPSGEHQDIDTYNTHKTAKKKSE